MKNKSQLKYLIDSINEEEITIDNRFKNYTIKQKITLLVKEYIVSAIIEANNLLDEDKNILLHYMDLYTNLAFDELESYYKPKNCEKHEEKKTSIYNAIFNSTDIDSDMKVKLLKVLHE